MVSTSAETAGSISRISDTNRTIPPKHVDLSKVPDEDTHVACTGNHPEIAQTNATPEPMEPERDHIRDAASRPRHFGVLTWINSYVYRKLSWLQVVS